MDPINYMYTTPPTTPRNDTKVKTPERPLPRTTTDHQINTVRRRLFTNTDYSTPVRPPTTTAPERPTKRKREET
jgi:hypothetical protein